MKTCRMMQHIVTELASRHGLDLDEPRSSMRLDLPGYDRLVVEVLHANLVSVAHVYEPQPGVCVADPGVVFFTGHAQQWAPIEISQRIGGYRVYAVLSEEMDDIVSVLAREQSDLADFVEFWAHNLLGQGWTEDATLTDLKSGLPF